MSSFKFLNLCVKFLSIALRWIGKPRAYLASCLITAENKYQSMNAKEYECMDRLYNYFNLSTSIWCIIFIFVLLSR